MNWPVVAFNVLQILILPWGLFGVSTYYPTKMLLVDRNSWTRTSDRVYEFAMAYWEGPFAAPLLVKSEVSRRYQQSTLRSRHQELHKQRREFLETKAHEILDILNRHVDDFQGQNQVLFQKAKDELYRDLLLIAKYPERGFKATSLGAIDDIKSCLNSTFVFQEEIWSALKAAEAIVG